MKKLNRFIFVYNNISIYYLKIEKKKKKKNIKRDT